jgi:AsmA protein
LSVFERRLARIAATCCDFVSHGEGMKILKFAAFALGGIAALLAAVVIYVAITFDAARVKSELKRVVLEQKQRTLDIEGDVDLSFYPNLGLNLGRTVLSEHNSADRFAVVDSAHVSVAVLPLLSGALVVDEVRIDGANVNVVRYKDGSLNVDDLMSEQKEESTAVKFDVAGLRLSRSALAFRDEASGAQHALDGIELTVGKLANTARGKLDLAAHWTSARPAADSNIAVVATYDYDLAAQRYALDDLNARVEGGVLDMKDVHIALAASRLEASAGGAIEARQLAFDAKAVRAGETIAVKVSAPSLRADADGVRGDELRVAATAESSAHFADVRVLLTGLEGSMDAVKAAGLTLDLDARQDTASVKGTLKSPVSVSMDGPAFELPALTGALDIAHPSLPMKSVSLPVKASARADLKAGNAAVDLETTLDGSRVRLKVAATKLEPLALDFDVDIDRLNADLYMPKQAAAGDRPAGNPDDAAVDLSMLRGINASGKVHIGELKVSGVNLTDVRLQVKAADGRLDLSPYSANLYRGAASGALSLNADGNRIALKQTLSDIDIHPLIHDATDKDIIEGRGMVTLDVSTAGATVGALKRALDGTAAMRLRDGAIRGINLAQRLRQAKSALGGGATVDKASATEKTDFTELSASFRIDDGVARNSDLAASSPFLRLAGSGSIDLVESSIDYLARVTLAATSTGQGGKTVDQLKGVTVPVRLVGPFASLDYRIEFGDLIKDAARSKVDAQTQKLKDKARDKVGEKLKGLLGR